MRRALALVGVFAALGAGAALPATAAAHATLEETTPGRGAVVADAPGSVAFRFDEPVSGTAGAVRVFDRGGAEVQQGRASAPGSDASVIAVRLRGGLGDGTYTATYRVVSADGHVISGGSTFSIGTESATSATVGELLDRDRAGPAVATGLDVARGVQYAAIAVGTGALAFLALVWLPALVRVAGGGDAWRLAADAFARRLLTLLLVTASLGALSAAAAIVLQAATAAGSSPPAAIRDGALGDALGTRFGEAWAAGLLCWMVFAAGVALMLRPAAERARLRPATLGAAGLAVPRLPARGLVAAVPALALLLLPALGGHAGSLDPVEVLVPASALHVAAAAVWVGGIACLLVPLRAATGRLEPADRTRLLVETLARFSGLALIAVVALALSGVVQAIGLLDGLDGLLSTAYGRLVLVKAGLLVALAGLGALQRRRVMPGLRAASAGGDPPGDAGVRLRRVLWSETALLTGVFIVTAVLSGTAPAPAAQAGPVTREATVGPARLQATVDPASPGTNVIHLYLLDPRTGAPWNGAEEVGVRVRQPELGIGPLRERALRAGPGHYVVRGAQLGAPGDWQVDVAVRVSDFDEYTAKLEVPVR